MQHCQAMNFAGPAFDSRHDAHRCLGHLAAAARLRAFAGSGHVRRGSVPSACRGDLAAALRTISRLRRGLLDAAERSALLRRLPRPVISSEGMPGDPATPCAPRPYAPPPPGRGSCLDAMA
jgi:hypothetical protein